MSGAIAGIGLRAIAGTVFGKVTGAGGSALKWLGSLDLVHLCLLIAVLFGGWQTVGRWSQHRHTAKVERQLSAISGQLAMARKDLATSQANETALKTAIADQNKAISDLSGQSTRQQEIAAKAQKTAAQRAAAAQAASDRLRLSARQNSGKPGAAANCEPSDTLKAQWRS